MPTLSERARKRTTAPRAGRRPLLVLAAALLWAAAWPPAQPSLGRDPIVYTVRLAPETQAAEVQAIVPTDRRATIDRMMPVWSPGFYRVENYATRASAAQKAHLQALVTSGRT